MSIQAPPLNSVKICHTEPPLLGPFYNASMHGTSAGGDLFSEVRDEVLAQKFKIEACSVSELHAWFQRPT